MAAKFDPSATFETMIDYCKGVESGAIADEQFAHLCVRFDARAAELIGLRDARNRDRWALLAAQRRVDVRETRLRAATGEVSGVAFLASGKRADRSPYADLFGTVKATDIASFGPANAIAAVGKVLERGRQSGVAALTESLDRLNAATAPLKAADESRTAAENTASRHEVIRGQEVARLDLLIGEAEAAILTDNPGRTDLVRALLGVVRKRRGGGGNGGGGKGGGAPV